MKKQIALFLIVWLSLTNLACAASASATSLETIPGCQWGACQSRGRPQPEPTRTAGQIDLHSPLHRRSLAERRLRRPGARPAG